MACFLWKIHRLVLCHQYGICCSQHCQHYEANTLSILTNTHMKPKINIEPANHPCRIRTNCIVAGMSMKNTSNQKARYLGLLEKFLGTLGYVWHMMTCDHTLSCTMHMSTEADPPICLIKI